MKMKALAFCLSYLVVQAYATISTEKGIQLETDLMKLKLKAFFGRYLYTEKETCNSVMITTTSLNDSLRLHVDVALSDVRNALDIFRDSIDSKNSLIINETILHIEDIIEKEITNFSHVVEVTQVRLKGLTSAVENTFIQFKTKYRTILDGISRCQHYYPNFKQKENKDNCISFYKELFQRLGDDIGVAFKESPCMTLFKKAILPSVADAFGKIKTQTDSLLGQMACVKGGGEVKINCLKTLPTIPSFEPSLIEQVEKAQSTYNNFNDIVESALNDYFIEEYEAKRKYSLEAKSKEEFILQLNQTLASKYVDLNEMLTHHPDDWNCACGKEAKTNMAELLHSVASRSTFCYENSVVHNLNSMRHIQTRLEEITEHFQRMGNVAILGCITYAKDTFKKNAIYDCFDLSLRVNSLHIKKTLKTVEEKRSNLQTSLLQLEDNGSLLDCMVEEKDYAVLYVDVVVYLYEDCLDGCRMDGKVILNNQHDENTTSSDELIIMISNTSNSEPTETTTMESEEQSTTDMYYNDGVVIIH